MANIERYTREETMFALISEWQNSSISKKQFCEQTQVGIHTFNYWLKKSKYKCQKSNHGFTEYKIIERKSHSPIRLNFPNGVVAEFPADFDYKQVHFLINNCK